MENNENSQEEEANKKKNYVRFFIVLGFIVTVLLLYVLSKNIESFSLKWFFIISGFALFLFGGVWLAFAFFSNKPMSTLTDDSSKKHPKAMTSEEIKNYFEKIFITNPQYFDYPNPEGQTIVTESHGVNGDQSIYCRRFSGEYTNKQFFVSINMHYPNRFSILSKPIDMSIEKFNSQINLSKKKVAINPESLSEESTIESFNPLTGIQQKIKTKKHKKDEKNDKPKSSGDLK